MNYNGSSESGEVKELQDNGLQISGCLLQGQLVTWIEGESYDEIWKFMETDRLRFIKGNTFLPSFWDIAQRLNLMTQKGVKSLHKDTFKLARKILVRDKFQSIILRYCKNFHLAHFTFHGNISLTLRRSCFQRLSRTFLFFYIFDYVLH